MVIITHNTTFALPAQILKLSHHICDKTPQFLQLFLLKYKNDTKSHISIKQSKRKGAIPTFIIIITVKLR